MHPRQAALLTTASRIIDAIAFPREFHLPKEIRGTEPENPEGTDLYVWKYESPGADGKIRYYAVAFVGKANKPLWHTIFRDEQSRQQTIDKEAENRRRVMDEKAKKRQERRDFQHSFQVEDILYSSWGYDQTNINFYQVTDVRGKEITIREIGKRTVGGHGSPSEKVMAEPNEFIGPPLRKRPQGSGEHTYVKVTESQTAFEWDGRPLHETGGAYGH
jgi:hypothetical protein